MVRDEVVVAPCGLKVAAAPEGKPDALKFTVPLKPFDGWMVTVSGAVVPPGATLRELGETVSEKSGFALANDNAQYPPAAFTQFCWMR